MELVKKSASTESRYKEGIYYKAHFLRMEDNGVTKFGPSLRAFFLVEEDGLEADYLTGVELTNGTKLGKMVNALRGEKAEPLEDGAVLDPATLAGLPCNLVFKTNSKDYDGEVAYFSNVSTVVEAEKGQKKLKEIPSKTYGPDEAPF